MINARLKLSFGNNHERAEKIFVRFLGLAVTGLVRRGVNVKMIWLGTSTPPRFVAMAHSNVIVPLSDRA